MKKALTFLTALLLFLALGSQSWADDYLRIRHVSEAYEIMGQKQPAGEEILETWISGNRARMNTSDNSSVILHADKQALYLLDHSQRTYTEVPLDLSKAMAGMMGGQEGGQEMAQMMAQMMGAMMQVSAKAVDTGAVKKVNNWNCRVYELTLKMPMGNTVSEICATEEINVDVSMYNRIGHAMMAGQQGFEEMIREMEKIKGVAVSTVTKANVMGATVVTREELLEHKKASAPAGSFDIPEGYAKQPFMGL